MKFLLIVPILFCSCANVASTRIFFKDANSTLAVDMPKEVETKKLKVKFNAKQGTIEITADSWVSTNQGTLLAQSSREKAILEGGSVLIEKAVESGVRGAMKGVVPIP